MAVNVPPSEFLFDTGRLFPMQPSRFTIRALQWISFSKESYDVDDVDNWQAPQPSTREKTRHHKRCNTEVSSSTMKKFAQHSCNFVCSRGGDFLLCRWMWLQSQFITSIAISPQVNYRETNKPNDIGFFLSVVRLRPMTVEALSVDQSTRKVSRRIRA